MPYSNIPEGDAYIFATPKLDQARQQLMMQQHQRMQYQQQDAAQSAQLIGRELSRIRSVDSPDILNMYNTAKNYKKQLLFDPKVQNNPQAYNDLNQKYNEALGQTFQAADQSAQYNQMGKDLFTSYRAHPDRYADDFGERYKAYQSTPMSGLQNHQMGDLSNPDTYRYQGSNTDFGSIYKKASGTPRVVYSAEEPVDAKGLQTKVTPYSYGNTPAQYYTNLVGELQKRGPGRDAAAAWDHLQAESPEEIQHVNEEFEKFTPQDWKKMTGSEKPQIINPDPSNKADQFAAFQAKAYAINNLPAEGKPVFRNNQANILGEKNAEREKLQQNGFQQQKIMQNIRNNESIGKIELHRLYAKQDAKTQDLLAGQHFQDEFKGASSGKQPISLPTESGAPLVGFVTDKPIGVIAKEFEGKDDKGHPVDPTQWLYSPDGKTMTAVYFKLGKDGKPVVDDSKTVQKSVDHSLKDVFKKYATPNAKGGTVSQPQPAIGQPNVSELRNKYGY